MSFLKSVDLKWDLQSNAGRTQRPASITDDYDCHKRAIDLMKGSRRAAVQLLKGPATTLPPFG